MTKSSLSCADFPEFFHQVRGHPPFQWQLRATEELADGKLWPSLEVPTGGGKTSLIDCLVFALACQSGRTRRTVPLRTFWVVDRRSVVDQVYAHASYVGQAITEGDGIVAIVRDRLERLDGLGGLVVQRWRGGLREREQQLRLTGPAIVCSTIDQVGSRLLFRGYGTTRRSRPLDAALTGTDSLVVLDEAHIAQPFLDTLSRVRDLGRSTRREISIPPLRTLTVSATLAEASEEAFRLNDEERRDSLITRRLEACKEVRLVRARRRSDALVTEARELAGSTEGVDGASPVIGVIANTVAEARTAYAALDSAGDEALLVIGPCRPFERDSLLGRIPDRSERAERTGPLFVVATQTIEVGVDLDFDGLVTAVAPLPALVQRLGRLDRQGERYAALGSPSPATIVSSREPCFVYGDVAADTWRWLDDRSERGSLIVDAAAVANLRSEDPPRLEGPLAPILGSWHLDALVQTTIDPVPSPAIGPFLHGEQALEQADVRVVWRADLYSADEEQWAATARLAPPQAHEAISVPIGRVKAWLRKGWSQGDDALTFGDVESVGGSERLPPQPGGRATLRWDPKQPEVVAPSAIRPGDTLVVPADYGGADEYGWNPGERRDVSDVADLAIGARYLRGHPALGRDSLIRATSEVVDRFEAGELDSREAYSDALRALGAADGIEPELAAAIAQLPPYGEFNRHPSGTGFILVGKQVGSPTVKPRRVTYKEHVKGVTRRVDSTARALGLEGPIREALVLAARVHDSGKIDPRFQTWMNGGSPPEGDAYSFGWDLAVLGSANGRTPLSEDALLAKSGRAQGTSLDERARRDSGWPEGMRHELWSAAFADEVAARERWPERDLIGYLVAVHHGQHRPFYDQQPDRHPTLLEARWNGEAVRLPSNDRLPWAEHARRFKALNRRFNPWGLAALEAVLVLADRAVSAAEQEA